MIDINAIAAWVGVLLGVISGAIVGIWFHQDHWLGGYGSWRRRMVRLGHIAFFGIAMLNLGYALTVRSVGWTPPPRVAADALAAAVVLMPAICFLSAWRKPMRRLFPIPVACVLAGVAGLLLRKVWP